MAFFSRIARRAARPMWATSAAVLGGAATFAYMQQSAVAECASTPRFLRAGHKEHDQTLLYQKYTARYGDRKNVNMTYLDVRELLHDLNIRNEYLVGRIFNIMDEDGSGTVDIDEMTKFCEGLAHGTFNQKSKFIFRACDINRNGVIEEYEIRKMIKNMILACHDGVPEYAMAKDEKEAALYHDLTNNAIAQFKANMMSFEVFKVADKDNSGGIDWKEFNFWIKRGGKSVNAFFELFHVFDLLDPKA